MNLTSFFAPKPEPKPEPEIFHDIFDFSILPFGLGDAINWSIKSSLRCLRAGRKGVHIHLVCDVKTSGCTILMPLAHAVDLFMLDLLSAFTSHPLFFSLTYHTSRTAFDQYWKNLSENDPAAREIYAEHLEIYEKRTNPLAVTTFLRKKSSLQAEINEWHKTTGNYPRLRVLPECAADVEALKASYPLKTFWVGIHSRLKRLDSGLKPSGSGQDFDRDANFTHWYHFLETAYKAFPHVRFVVLGRLQEKPLALLQLPNVVTLRALGMSIGHEIAFVNACDLFMGSLAGYSQMALFSPTNYSVINCSEQGCEHLGIPFGTPQLPFALPGQRLYYGKENSDLLVDLLKERLVAASSETALSATSTTHRFFISPQQETRELYTVVEAQLLPLALKWDAGEVDAVRKELRIMDETFPHIVSNLSIYRLLKDLDDLERLTPVGEEVAAAFASQKKLLLARLVQLLYPKSLEPSHGLYPRTLHGCSGLRRDGWCSEETHFTLGTSVRGSTLVLNFGITATGHPMTATLLVQDEKPVEVTLAPTASEHRLLMEHDHPRTLIAIRFSASGPLGAADPHVCSAHLHGIRIAD